MSYETVLRVCASRYVAHSESMVYLGEMVLESWLLRDSADAPQKLRTASAAEGCMPKACRPIKRPAKAGCEINNQNRKDEE